MIRNKLFFMMILVSLLPAACSDSSDNEPVMENSGFYEIEPIHFSFQNYGPTLSYTSSKIRVSYSFFPADESPDTKPLFVFFNGGPGCATCTGLLSLNTAPFTLDRTRPDSIKANPYSFTRLGNLLYIDAPNTGFSYNLVKHADKKDVRKTEFEARNFNPFIDAAQVTRVLLRFMADHPAIEDNQVIIVGESYGGTRASTMLNMLLFYSRYGDGSRIYRDIALASEIQKHFERINSSCKGRIVTPEAVASQFGGQILIEPLLTGHYQDELTGEAYEKEGSVIFDIAQSTGTTYTPCGGRPDCHAFDNALDFVVKTAKRDVYQYDMDEGYTMGISNYNRSMVDRESILSQMLGRDVFSIRLLYPSARKNAYRYIESESRDALAVIEGPGFGKLPAAERMRIKKKVMLKTLESEEIRPEEATDTLEMVLGPLNPWDAYVVGCNDAVNSTFYNNEAINAGYPIDPMNDIFGGMFLENLALVDTLITDCDLDLVIYAAVLPDSIKEYADIVEDVVWDDSTEDGYIYVYYRPRTLPDIETPDMRPIYFPRYRVSGHMVTLAQPDKFLNDVERWLS
ncbi:MAG TPA: hypothetical protein VIS94_03885 [Desulfomonilia bacterium]